MEAVVTTSAIRVRFARDRPDGSHDYKRASQTFFGQVTINMSHDFATTGGEIYPQQLASLRF